eukprot:TRINITY_DN24811_c0_g1_i2.p1 TRINITY_DN24811_c0_g1~~TRINITY_DN24811_c0_g1_i2.p1  ORF type:complete len:206 (+),score=61.43 TRINITY_DN24811_c0_g1_i2:100-717(+)
MIRRPPRSTLSSSSAASDVYKRQVEDPDQQEQGAASPSPDLNDMLPDKYKVVMAVAEVEEPHRDPNPNPNCEHHRDQSHTQQGVSEEGVSDRTAQIIQNLQTIQDGVAPRSPEQGELPSQIETPPAEVFSDSEQEDDPEPIPSEGVARGRVLQSTARLDQFDGATLDALIPDPNLGSLQGVLSEPEFSPAIEMLFTVYRLSLIHI